MRKAVDWFLEHPKTSGLLLLIVVLLAGHLALTRRADRRWQDYVSAQRQAGLPMNLQDVIPPAVADGENFARTAIGTEIAAGKSPFKAMAGGSGAPSKGDWLNARPIDWAEWARYAIAGKLIAEAPAGEAPARTVLRAMDQSLGSEIAAWREATARPRTRFDLPYEKGIALTLPYTTPLQETGAFFSLRARAKLAEGDSAAAFDALQDAWAARRVIAQEPTLIPCLVRSTIFQIGLVAVGEGLATHRWAGPELAKIDHLLSLERPVEDHVFAVCSDRAVTNSFLEKIAEASNQERARMFGNMANQPASSATNWTLVPRWAVRDNMLLINQVYDQHLARLHCEGGQVRYHPEVRVDVDCLQSPVKRFYYLLANIFAPILETIEQRCVFSASMIDQARIAIALERHRLAHGQFPDTLQALVPEFLPAIPTELSSGQPFRYERQAGQSFRLYGVGFDKTDNGGTINPKKSEFRQSDQIWLYAPPAAAASAGQP